MELHQPQITYINAKLHADTLFDKMEVPLDCQDMITPEEITEYEEAYEAELDAQDALIKWGLDTYPEFAKLDCYAELDMHTQGKIANVLSKRLY